jgi:hypothetical protein
MILIKVISPCTFDSNHMYVIRIQHGEIEETTFNLKLLLLVEPRLRPKSVYGLGWHRAIDAASIGVCSILLRSNISTNK